MTKPRMTKAHWRFIGVGVAVCFALGMLAGWIAPAATVVLGFVVIVLASFGAQAHDIAQGGSDDRTRN